MWVFITNWFIVPWGTRSFQLGILIDSVVDVWDQRRERDVANEFFSVGEVIIDA